MSIIGAFLDPFPRIRSESSGVANPSQWLVDWFRGTDSDSGVSVTPESALTYSTVFQALTILSGDPGQLPLEMYRRTGDEGLDKERDKTHRAYGLLRHRPNPYMSAQTFIETMQLYALMWGNGVAEIERDRANRPVALWPLLPNRVEMLPVGGKPWYVVRMADNTTRKLQQQNVLHIIGMSWDGIWGIPVVTKARNSWGLGMAGEKFANRLFSNQAMPAGVLEYPGSLQDPEHVKRLRKDWGKMHEGLDNVGRIAILEDGMKFNPISFSNKDSQWLEGRKFQRTEVASWFNLPPHKLGDLERATFSNIEQQNLDYLNTSLMRWLVKWQTEAREKLLTAEERNADSHFFEFNTAALLRGDLMTRYRAYTLGINNRFLMPNEARRAESMAGYDGGNEILVPLNIQQPAEDEPDDEDADDSSTEAKLRRTEDRFRQAVRARLDDVTQVEAKRIRQAAAVGTGFVDWFESFYTEGQWPKTLQGVLNSLAVWDADATATAWCDESSAGLNRLVDTTTLSDLVAATETMLATWPARIDRLVATMCEDRE